jgi:phospholipid/cholesterol/gamma-HCH transport system permease protein
MSDSAARLTSDARGATLALAGDWRLAQLVARERDLRAALRDLPRGQPLHIDASGCAALDSAGAWLILDRVARAGIDPARLNISGASPRQTRLLALLRERFEARPAQTRERHPLAHLGAWAHGALDEAIGRLSFLGHVGAAGAELAIHPSRLRAREIFVQFEAAGVRALPICALMTFLIGVVFAYLLGLQIEKFGANIFIVDGVAIAITRELGPMLVAVIVAGRSGAAYTAQIGAMKVAEEIDAIQVLGLSPYQVLVLPRLIALVLMLPLLVFIGDIAGILGSMGIAQLQLGITPTTFMDRLHAIAPMTHVVIGLIKAPVFATAIALAACHNGLSAARDARSVGQKTTATVVESIVAVILIDSAFAVVLGILDL